jgi:hypothetical protein
METRIRGCGSLEHIRRTHCAWNCKGASFQSPDSALPETGANRWAGCQSRRSAQRIYLEQQPPRPRCRRPTLVAASELRLIRDGDMTVEQKLVVLGADVFADRPLRAPVTPAFLYYALPWTYVVAYAG